MNPLLVASGLLGFCAIALGAYGDHGLRGNIDPEILRSFETAVRYQLFHAVALLAIGAGLSSGTPKRIFWSALILLAGTVIFSGSIYLKVIFGIDAATRAAPAGGMMIMAGWLSFIWAGMKKGASK